MNSNIFDTNVKNIKKFNQIDCLSLCYTPLHGFNKNVSEKIISIEFWKKIITEFLDSNYGLE